MGDTEEVMATYVIKAPSGETFEITAPDNASEQDVLAYAKEQFKAAEQPQNTPEPAPQTPISALSAFGMGAAQGASFGLADEAKSALQALSPNVTYSDALTENRANLASARDQHGLAAGSGEVLGAIAGGLGIGGAARLAAPKAASALASFGAAHPYIASSGLGAGGGSVYGFGSGEGGFDQRAENAIGSGVAGAVAGPAVAYGLRNVAGPAIQGTTTALAKLTGKADNLVPETAPTSIADLERPNGEMFSKTAGQRTQKAELQTLEADAVGGRYGPEAEGTVRNALKIQNQERRQFIQALSPKATSELEVNDILDGVHTRVSEKAKALNQKVTNAYDIAKQGNSVLIKSQDIDTGLMSEIARVRNETGVNLLDKTNYSKANASIDALAEKLKSTKGTKITAVKLADLEDWRKTLTNYANDATGTEKAFLSKVRASYDDFMIKTANEAVDSGDKDAILAFRNAVGLRRQYGEMFEKNKIVESIAEGKTVDDFAKDLIGTGSIAGKKGMMDNVQALVKAGGDEGDLVKQDIADAFIKRLYTRAADGFEEGAPDLKTISPAKMANELRTMFVNNKELGNYLYGEEATKIARKAISELELVSKKQPSTQNPSGSGYVVARILRNTGITKIPGFSLANDVLESSTRAKGQAQVEKSLKDFYQPKSKMFSTKTGLAGPAAGSLNAQDDELNVTVPIDVKDGIIQQQ